MTFLVFLVILRPVQGDVPLCLCVALLFALGQALLGAYNTDFR